MNNTISLKKISEKPAPYGTEYQVTVSAKDWHDYKSLSAEKAALENRIKSLVASWDLPDARELAESFELTQEEGFTVTIVNGSGDVQGKLTVFWHSGATIAADWRRRIS